MNGRVAKEQRRKIRRAFGPEFEEAVAVFMEAHERGLRQHGLILNAVIFAGFWGRLRWLLFGVRRIPHRTTHDGQTEAQNENR